MRRPLGVLACLVSVAALSSPVATAQAASTPPAECRLFAARPNVTATGNIQASARWFGCGRPTLVLFRATAGPDQVVKGSARRAGNGRMTVELPCASGVYYSVATDRLGNVAQSRPARLSCSSTGTPTPVPTPSPNPSQPGGPTPTPVTPPPAGGVGTPEENEVVRLTNAERAKGGCQPLKADAQLRKAAFGHSSDMATQNYFSHTSKDGRTFMERIRGAGFTGGSAFAENIAMGYPNPAAVVVGWMKSSGHRANIMNCNYNLIGVGAAKNSKGQIYWTQNFARR
ncbi:CAP domain-containing protein [Nonomuraea lactucae]|uniref:CAP domain-containing protein n=1 Tax=Nonomuraea lactucae TaxID=2249762 RepID=UPI0013B41342|nr:CAP domain-containing protein [Nonomuraea lactucae]